MSWIVLLTLSGIGTVFAEAIYIPQSVLGKDKSDISKILFKNLAVPATLPTEDSLLNITQLATKYGYIIEVHKATTEDGYILGLHRLAKNNNQATNGTPIFLMHGLIDSSDSWILQGPNNALGYLLADLGYDVWMGNARGNKHSLSHTNFSSNENRFWKYTWEEIGVYDLPAMIDYVLNLTGKENLYYVGHSQGTTSFFVMNSLKPEFNTKIKMMFALSPVAWMSHASSPVLKYLSSSSNVLQYFLFFNTLTPTNFLNQMYGAICKVMSTGCSNMFELLFGSNHFVSDSMLPVILGHSPTGSSVLQFVHYWQLYESRRFCRFDYGWMGNLKEYLKFSPPDYDLSNITVPIVLFYSSNDWLSHPLDVATLKSNLPNVCKCYYSQYFSHIDYIYASVAKDAVYVKIIEDIENFERQS